MDTCTNIWHVCTSNHTHTHTHIHSPFSSSVSNQYLNTAANLATIIPLLHLHGNECIVLHLPFLPDPAHKHSGTQHCEQHRKNITFTAGQVPALLYRFISSGKKSTNHRKCLGHFPQHSLLNSLTNRGGSAICKLFSQKGS